MARFSCKTFFIVIAIVFGVSSASFAKGWFVSVGGSGYSASDSVGPGYLVFLGGGYMFSDYWGVTASFGFAQYAIEIEKEGEKERLDVYEIPISLGARFYLAPEAPVNPFLEAGPTAYLTKVEKEDWTNTWGAYVMGGIAIRVGSGGFEIWVRYSLSDIEDTSQYRLTYGLGGSFSGI